jgi:hypothetical protein
MTAIPYRSNRLPPPPHLDVLGCEMPVPTDAREPVSIKVDGKIRDGLFLTRAKMVTVWYADRSKGAYLFGSCEPEVLARVLLSELVCEHRDRAELS